MIYSEKAAKMLLEKGIKPSPIRLKVLTFLLKNPTHPTADEIYQELQKEILTLSKTSVYNALSLFLRLNLVKSVNIDEKETRYDANIEEHGHFQCLSCKQIYDFFHVPRLEEKEELNDFMIKEKRYYYYGLCPECQQKEENNEKFNWNKNS